MTRAELIAVVPVRICFNLRSRALGREHAQVRLQLVDPASTGSGVPEVTPSAHLEYGSRERDGSSGALMAYDRIAIDRVEQGETANLYLLGDTLGLLMLKWSGDLDPSTEIDGVFDSKVESVCARLKGCSEFVASFNAVTEKWQGQLVDPSRYALLNDWQPTGGDIFATMWNSRTVVLSDDQELSDVLQEWTSDQTAVRGDGYRFDFGRNWLVKRDGAAYVSVLNHYLALQYFAAKCEIMLRAASRLHDELKQRGLPSNRRLAVTRLRWMLEDTLMQYSDVKIHRQGDRDFFAQVAGLYEIEAMLESVKERLEMLQRRVDEVDGASSRRYVLLVQSVLVFIGSLALVDLLLNMMWFSVDETGRSRVESDGLVGPLQWLVDASPDLIVGAALVGGVVAAAAALLIALIRRK